MHLSRSSWYIESASTTADREILRRVDCCVACTSYGYLSVRLYGFHSPVIAPVRSTARNCILPPLCVVDRRGDRGDAFDDDVSLSSELARTRSGIETWSAPFIKTKSSRATWPYPTRSSFLRHTWIVADSSSCLTQSAEIDEKSGHGATTSPYIPRRSSPRRWVGTFESTALTETPPVTAHSASAYIRTFCVERAGSL